MCRNALPFAQKRPSDAAPPRPPQRPLEDVGFVAFTSRGHWWAYPTRANPERMHEVARFNLGIACSSCLAAWHGVIRPVAPGVAWRVN